MVFLNVEKVSPSIGGVRIRGRKMNVKPEKTIVVETQAGRNLRFQGVELASMYREIGTGRGIEKTVYKTKGGTYILEIVKTTQWQDESDVREVARAKNHEDVIMWFSESLDEDTKSMLERAGIDVCEDIE